MPSREELREFIGEPVPICVCGHGFDEHGIFEKHYEECKVPGCGCGNFESPAMAEWIRLRHEQVEREIAARRDDGAAR